MNYNKNPLTPHLQVYKWHISSLLSITHRIVGVLNFFSIIIFCIWLILYKVDQSTFQNIASFFTTKTGKFLILSICWSYSFFILNEIRHLAWDLGYGFELKTANLSGLAVFFGSLLPLKLWLILNIASIFQNDASLIIEFIASQPSKLIFSLFLVVFFFFFSLTISEIFEDYINNEKIKNVANKFLYLFAILFSLITLFSIYNL